MADAENWPPLSPFRTGLAGRCPRCGRGRLFDGLAKLRDSCAECGLDLSACHSGDGPAVFIILLLGTTIVPLAFWLEIALAPPLWLHALIWTAATLAGTLGLLRPFKGVLTALQHVHRTPGQ